MAAGSTGVFLAVGGGWGEFVSSEAVPHPGISNKEAAAMQSRIIFFIRGILIEDFNRQEIT